MAWRNIRSVFLSLNHHHSSTIRLPPLKPTGQGPSLLQHLQKTTISSWGFSKLNDLRFSSTVSTIFDIHERELEAGVSKPSIDDSSKRELEVGDSKPSVNDASERELEAGDSKNCIEAAKLKGSEPRQEERNRFIPVRTFFLCTSVDLKSLQAENGKNVIPPTSRVGAANYILFRYCNLPGLEDFTIPSCSRYMVVFQYGSAVMFNIGDHEVDRYLEIVRKHASGLLPEMRKDEYAVVEKPSLETWMQGGHDYIVLKHLDADGIRIIGSILGQSTALDYFIRQVDDMVDEFTDINRGMEKTGTFTMQRKKLFQLVGRSNSSLADVILKLGLFERSEIAWRNANYAQVWEYLRDEYELAPRFASLDFKLKFVEHNIHFLQEILQNRKSDFLEWVIIILISLECVLSVYEIIQGSKLTSL
ncbi:hypothetical protein AMTRI_Chr10g1130 [Amborella trichopoda]